MPANLPAEYYVKEREYHEAKTKEEKIRKLQEMLAVIPKHKGTERLIGMIKQRIAKLKAQLEKERARKKGRSFAIKKEGVAQVCLVGPANSGKSYLLNKLCNKEIPSTPTPFETMKPEVGMLDYEGIKVQLVEIPSLYEGFSKKRREFMGILHTCDLIVYLGEKEFVKELDEVKDKVIFCEADPEKLKAKIWDALELIKVYTKEPGKPPSSIALGLRRGATVRELCEKIHQDLVRKFRYARIIRKHGKLREIRAGLNFVLEDGDIVEIHA